MKRVVPVQASRQIRPMSAGVDRRRRCLVLTAAGVVAGSLVSAQSLSAQNVFKENNQFNLDQTTSWVGGLVPDSDDIATWNSIVTGTNVTTLGSDLSWLGIQILNPGGAVTINGTNSLTLGTAGIDLSRATQNLNLNSPIILNGAQRWNVAAVRTLAIGSAQISGVGGLTFNGAGTITLNVATGANNTYTGGTTVNNGVLNLNLNGSSLSSFTGSALPSAGTLTVGGGAIRQVTGSGNAGQVPFGQSVGTLSIVPGTSSFTQIRGASARAIATFNRVERLTPGGVIGLVNDNPNGGGFRAPNAAGQTNLVVDGVVPFMTFQTTATNVGFFNPAGTGNNGAVVAGTASDPSLLGTSTTNVNVSTDVTLAAAAATVVNTLRFQDATAGRTITNAADGSLTIDAGAILVTNLTGNRTSTITGGTLTGAPSGVLGSPTASAELLVINYNNPANGANARLDIGSTIIDSGSATALTKTGIGSLFLLNAANTYTGKTYLSGGLTRIAADGSLGTAPGAAITDAITFSNGTLQLGNNLDVAANRGLLLNVNGGTVDTNGFASNYGGSISGVGSFSKSGTGTLNLAGNSTHTGATNVFGGTLGVAGGTLGNTAINVSTGATFRGASGSAGSTGAGVSGASLTLNSGSAFSMVDGATAQFNLNQQSSFTGSGLVIGGATGVAPELTFEINNSATDTLNLSGGVSLGAVGGKIAIAATPSATALTPGNYTLITAASGLGTSALSLKSSFLFNGGTLFSFSLANSTATSEILTVAQQAAAFWKGDINNVWTTGSPGTTTNWRADPNGTVPTGIPGANDVVIFSVNSGAANQNTVLGADFSIKGLVFSDPVPVTIGGANTLTLGDAGITVDATAGAPTISSGLGLGVTQTWTNASANPLTIGGVLSGAAADLTVESGSYVISNTATLGSLAGAGSIALAGSGALSVGVSGASTGYSGALTGVGTLTKEGAGTFALTGPNTFAGGTTINGGVLSTASAASLGDAAGTLTINAGTLQAVAGYTTGRAINLGSASSAILVDGGQVLTASGAINGTGSLNKFGTGTLALTTVANGFTGKTAIAGGTLQIVDDSTLGTAPGAAVADGISFTGGTLRITSPTALSANRGVTINGGTATIDTDVNAVTYAGVITGTGGLAKLGNGTLTLTGASNYAGDTNVNGGTLELGVGGTISSASVNVAQATGTRLTINGGSLSASANSTINPTGNGFLLSSGTATFAATLATNTGTDNSLIRVDGGLLTATEINLARTSNNVTAASATTGLFITGGTVDTGTLRVGSSNSSASVNLSGGTLSATGAVTVGNQNTSGRGGIIDVNSGTFTVSDVANGLILSRATASNANNVAVARFLGGTSTIEKITLGFNDIVTPVTAGSATVTVNATDNVSNPTFLYVGSGGIVNNGSGTFVGTVNLTNGTLGAKDDWATAQTLDVNGSAFTLKAADAADVARNITLNGVISGAGAVTKTGGGAVLFNNDGNTFATAMTVSGGTVGGEGKTPAVTFAANTTLSPGNPAVAAVGTIDTGNLTLSANSTLLAEVDFNNDLSAATTPTGDLVNVTGTVDITNANVAFSFIEINDGGPLGSPKTLVLIRNDNGADAVTGNFANAVNPGFWTIVTNYDADTSTFGTGNDVAVTFDAVPEPASLGLIGLAAAGLLARRRRTIRAR